MRKNWMLLLVPLVPLVAYGSLAAYLRYDFTRNVDALIEKAAPFATIAYGGIKTSLMGEVGLDEVVIRPTLVDDQVTIREVRLTAPNALYFVSAGKSMKRGALPEQIGISLRGIGINLNGALAQMLAQMEGQSTTGKATWFEQLGAIGCGDKLRLGLADMTKAGVASLNTDITLSMRYDEVIRRLSVDLALIEPGLYRVEGKLHAEVTGKLRELDELHMPKAVMKYTDSGWYQFRNDYCAQLNHGTVDEYVDRKLALLSEQLGIGLPPEVAQAYRGFLRQGGTVSVTVAPPPGTALDGLSAYPPLQLAELLGLKLTVNQVELDPSRVTWNEPKKLGAEKEDAVREDQRFVRPSVADPTPVILKPAYESIALDGLERQLDRTLRVTTYLNEVREGELIGLDEDKLHMALRHPSGALTFTILRADITKVEVKRR